MACGITIAKYTLFVVNFLFFALGCLALALGIVALVSNNTLSVLTQIGDAKNYDVPSLMRTGAILLLVGGAVAIVIGFLGCCGACKNNKTMLLIYSGIIFVVLMLEIAAAIIAIVFTADVASKLKPVLLERINASYDGLLTTGDSFTLGVNYAQVKFKCCGVNNYMDFKGASRWNKTLSGGQTAQIPLTCCKLNNSDAYIDNPSSAKPTATDCQYNPSDTNSYWKTGCYDAVIDYGKQNAGYVIGVGIAIVVVEILCFVFACCLIRAMKDYTANP